MIIVEVGFQDPAQMSFAQHNHMIQTLAAD
jgi:hypothetical protein